MLFWQAIRFFVWRRFRSVRQDDARAIAWAPSIIVLMTGCGFLWGVMVLELYQIEDFELRIFLIFVVASMLTGGALTCMAPLPSFYGYMVAAVLPMISTFLWHGTTTALLIAGMRVVYVALPTTTSAPPIAASPISSRSSSRRRRSSPICAAPRRAPSTPTASSRTFSPI